MADYVPSNDTQLSLWLTNFVTVLTVNAAQVGLVAGDVTPIDDASSEFGMALSNYQQQLNLTKGASSNRKTKRTDAVAILRPLVRRIQGHPGMTDQLRSLLGLVPEDLMPEATPIEELIPAVYLESAVGQVTVHWGPNPTNERINGKPLGVQGARIYRKKSGEDDFQIVGYARTSPFYDSVTGPGSDYTYYVRYQGTKATDLSPQSEEATVAARGALAA